MIKKILIGLGVVIVLLIAAVVVAPMLIPARTIVAEIAKQVERQTGRSLTIGGEPSVSVFPSLALQLEDVKLGNAPGGKATHMATLKRLSVALDPMPALVGEIVVSAFVLEEPVINLEVDKSGRPNWDLQAAAPAGTEGASSGPSQGSGTSSGSGGGAGADFVRNIRLGDMRLVNGLVSYVDAGSGLSERIESIDAQVKLPGLSMPFGFDGDLTWHGETMDLALNVDAPQALLDGRTAKLDATVASRHLNFSYSGDATLGEPVRLVGDISLDTPSIREFSAWVGAPVPADVGGDGLGPLSIQGNLTATPKNIAFTDASVAIDKIDATGSLNVALGRRKLNIDATLDIEALDLNRYLPPEAGDGPGAEDASSDGSGGPAKKGPPPDWSDDPIDLSGLHRANANLKLTLGALQIRQIKIGRSAAVVRLNDGHMRADLTELNMYGGKASGAVTIDATGATPRIEEKFTISGLQALPLLTDAADMDKLEGVAHATLNTSTRGRSQRQMVQNLNGSGDVKFLDGAIIGVNLAAMVRNIGSAFLDARAGKRQKTDFAELSGTFRISRGVLSNNDLEMVAPLIRLAGEGTSNLPERTLDYRIEPKAVASLEGQGVGADAKGITVPVKVTGPWRDLKYEPDLAGAIAGGGIEAIEDLVKDPGSALKNVLGGGQGGSSDARPGAGDVLDQLLGGERRQGDSDQSPENNLEDAGKQLLKGLFDN